MDALSSTVASTIKLSAPATLQSTQPTHHLKTPLLPPHQPYRSRRTSISNTSRRNSLTHTTRHDPSPRTPSPPKAQRRAATGYAAALLDIAQCSNALPKVEKDVRRFSRLLGNDQLREVLEDPETAEAEKGRVVRELAEKGRFHKSLVGLVKVLVDKNREVGLVAQVMEEFERIYDQLSGTSVVLVSSAAKMQREELFGIARRVQMISGAAKVKVKNLVGPDQSSSSLTPSFSY